MDQMGSGFWWLYREGTYVCSVTEEVSLRPLRYEQLFDSAESLPPMAANGGPTAGLTYGPGWGESPTDVDVTPGWRAALRAAGRT